MPNDFSSRELRLAVVASVALLAACRGHRTHWAEPVRPATAVGDAACIACHRDKAPFEGTAHRLTMRYPKRSAIAGSFHGGENVLRTSNPGISFRTDSDSAGYSQTVIDSSVLPPHTRTERIAFVAGSGRKGQSFLYWSGDRLFQLPVSYWTARGGWFNSPGRSSMDPQASFARAVAPRCLECHATWLEPVPDPSVVNRFRPAGAILGVTCERCHASGAEHVARERSLLHAYRDPAIVNPARLSRARQMDSCAQCHAGPGVPRTPPFTYVAGRPLEDFLHVIPRADDETVDVHANQVALLERSRCFRESQMTCLTCHDVHRPQRNVAELSSRCLTCHKEQSCGLFPQHGHALLGHCADCHMPLQQSSLVVSGVGGVQAGIRGRNHWIRVYPETAIP